MTNALKSIVSCHELGIPESLEGVYFGHAFSKACRYTTIDEKLSSNLQLVSIKVVQSTIQACIIWPKKSRKGKVEWARAYLYASLQPWKFSTPMKTRFASKFVMFHETLQF